MGRPNWRKESDYTFTETLTPEGWAWEFLRRNSEYQKDWKNLQAEAKRHQKRYGEDWAENEETWVYEPPRRPKETPREWRYRCIYEEPDFDELKLEVSYARRWGLKAQLYNPALSFDEHYRDVLFRDPAEFPISVDGPISLKRFLERDLTDELDVIIPPIAVLAFDVTRPIDHQLKNAKKRLMLQKKSVRNAFPAFDKRQRQDTWKFYLCVLDAVDDGSTHENIGVTLKIGPEDEYPDKLATNRTRHYYARACRVMLDHTQALRPSKRRKKTRK